MCFFVRIVTPANALSAGVPAAVLPVLSSVEGRIKMYKYELIVFWSDEDDRYVAEVPELPGCMADGGTYEEAVKNSQQIIFEWIETAENIGREIPQPKGRLAYA